MCRVCQQGILDQFNPSLKNFVTMGKHYEKALTGWYIFTEVCQNYSAFVIWHLLSSAGVTVAAKGYFDALVKLGELASDSQGSKELGEFAAEEPSEASGSKSGEDQLV